MTDRIPHVYTAEEQRILDRMCADSCRAEELIPIEELEAHAMSRYEPVEFEGCEVTKETEKAFLIDIEGKPTWIPKSQVHDDSEIYDNGPKDKSLDGTLVIPRWLAEEKDLV